MAATFVVEDGTGLSDANSYLSEAGADQYFDNHGAPTAWSSLAQAAKEEALRLGTQYLDAVYGARWKGERVLATQALDWPRNNVADRDGFAVEDDEVPTAVEDATAEAAIRSLTATLIPDITTPGGIRSQRDKVGPIETETVYAGAASQTIRFRIIDLLLVALIKGLGVSRS